MFKQLPMIAAFSLAASASFAEVSEADACAYFSQFAAVEPTVRANTVQRSDDAYQFQVTSVAIERYATLLSSPMIYEYGHTNSQGAFVLEGLFSLQMSCFADIVDRQILEINVFPGSNVGEVRDLGRLGNREIVAVQNAAFQPVLETHEGKY